MKRIEDYEPMIMSIIVKLGVMFDREEYMQIGRIAVFNAQSKFDSEKAKCTLNQFIYTNIYQRMVDQIRKESNYQNHHAPTDDTLLDIHEASTAMNNYLFEDIKKYLDTREQFVCARLIEGYKLTEIAREMNISNSTAKNIRTSIRSKLRSYFYTIEK